jgi:hypothetical protein
VGNGACVEVGRDASAVAVRDTTDRGGVVLAVPVAAWTAFTDSLR